MKKYIKNMFNYTVILLIIWVFVCSIMQAFYCSKLTQTELLLRFPSSFIADFKKCEK